MKLGLHINAITYVDKKWADICSIAKDMGLKTLEPGPGGFVGKKHCNPSELLKDKELLKKFLKPLEENDLEISALSCHGNPFHPGRDIAEEHADDLLNSIELASRIGVKIVNCFVGCPGLGEDARYPAWVTIRWPEEFFAGLNWQWDAKIIPFWKEMVRKARKAKVKFGIEMHPGNTVFNPEALLKLREALDAEEIACNLDPSHLFWQGINPLVCIKKLGDAVIHVHIKDTKINKDIVEYKGVMTEALFGELEKRAWTFRVIGKGHGLTSGKNLFQP